MEFYLTLFLGKIKMKIFSEKHKKITLINHPNQDTFRLNCSVPKSCLTLWHHGLQHAKFPCPSLSPGVCSNSCLLSQWCHPTISSSVAHLSSCHQSFPAPGSFQWVSSLHQVAKCWSFSISPSNEYSGLISFRIDWFDLLADQGTLKSLLQHHSSKSSILWHSAFFTVQLSHPYMTTGKP